METSFLCFPAPPLAAFGYPFCDKNALEAIALEFEGKHQKHNKLRLQHAKHN